MAQGALRRDDQHPLRAHGGEQTAGQRQIIQRQKRRAHPFQRRDKRRSGQRRARRKARRGLQRHNRPLLRHALRAESDDVPASRRPAQENALPLAQPQRALPRLRGQQLFQPPPTAQRAFFHAQHRRSGRIGAQKPPPHPRGLRSRAAQSPRVIARQIQRRRPCRRLHPADRAGRDARIQQPCQRARARRRAGARPREHNAKPHFFALLPFSTGIIYAFRRPNTQKKSRGGGKNP